MGNENMTPEDVADAKERKRAGKAYDKAMTNTPAAPMPSPQASSPKRSAAVEEAIQEMKDAKDREKIRGMGFKKGGYVKAADGIAQRGKTRGTVVMCGGGMTRK